MNLAQGLAPEALQNYEKHLTAMLDDELLHINVGDDMTREQQDTLHSLVPLYVLPQLRNALFRHTRQGVSEIVLVAAQAVALAKVIYGSQGAYDWLYAGKKRYAGKSPIQALIDGDVTGDDLQSDLIRTLEGYVF